MKYNFEEAGTIRLSSVMEDMTLAIYGKDVARIGKVLEVGNFMKECHSVRS